MGSVERLGASLAPNPGDTSARLNTFRPDLEGLRAVAVLLVLVFHLGTPVLRGGFIGVDVFFVLSGFLITGLILRELDATGTVSLTRFYARRARRLMPAASATIIVTVVAGALFLPAILVREIGVDGLASALYVANIHFARATNYFHDATNPSPLLHMWSLSAEEQFYLLWPALLLLAGRFRPRRLAVGTVVAASIAASFVLSVWLTGVAAPWAFYSLPTRIWQLAIGGLLAVLASGGMSLPNGASRMGGAVGLVSIVMAAVFLTPETPYPGLAALLPAVGAALVIAAGLRDGSLGVRGLAAAPMRWVGRISYSLYLWHWPVLVLPIEAAQVELPIWARCVLVAATFPIAAASHRWIEEPIRHGRLVGLPPRRSLVVVGTMVAVVAATSLGVSRLYPRHDLGDAPLVYDDGCNADSSAEVASEACVYGRADGGPTVVLYGDSRAAQWFPALEDLAEEHGWRLVSLTKNACPFVDVEVWDRDWLRPYRECQLWRASARARIAAEMPQVIVVASGSNYSLVDDESPLSIDASGPGWASGLEQTLGELSQEAAHVVVLGVTPTSRLEPPVCLAVHARDPGQCSTPRAQAVDEARRLIEREAATKTGAIFVDPTDWICPADPCPVVLGPQPIYRDQRHLSATFARSLAGRIGLALPPASSSR